MSKQIQFDDIPTLGDQQQQQQSRNSRQYDEDDSARMMESSMMYNSLLAENISMEQDLYRNTQSQLLNILQRVQDTITDAADGVEAHEAVYPIDNDNTMSVLKLDLAQSSAMNPYSPIARRRMLLDQEALLSTLDPKSQSRLILQKLNQCKSHIDKLRARIVDTSCKVLVTGDVNSGKSTLINALLKREVLPMDMQPCTAGFVEVVDASLNQNTAGVQVEEIHEIHNDRVDKYSSNDQSTYQRYDMEKLHDLVGGSDTEDEQQQQQQYVKQSNTQYKVYCQNSSDSILHNGVTDVKFVDSPGLNRDTAKTMSVFARSDEIDAVIFVVSAENHFTMSGIEFITEASREKPFMFIAANKFDVIAESGPSNSTFTKSGVAAMERCKRSILRQVSSLLPRTYAKQKDFVHFISAKKYLYNELKRIDILKNVPMQDIEERDMILSSMDQSFLMLESSLKSFLIHKRILSKLCPAKAYLENTLADLLSIATANGDKALEECELSESLLHTLSPQHQQLMEFKKIFEQRVEEMSRDVDTTVQHESRLIIEKFVDQVQGLVDSVEYPGVLRIWQYADAIVRKCNQELFKEFAKLDQDTLELTNTSVINLYTYADKNVPGWSDAIAMESLAAKIPQSITDVSLRADSLIQPKVDVMDFIDIPQHFGLVGVSLGSATIIVGGFVGYTKMAQTIYHTGRMFGLKTGTQWLWATFTVASVGTMTAVLLDAKSTLRRRLTRKIKHQVRKSPRVRSQLDKIVYGKKSILEQIAYDFRHVIHQRVDESERQILNLNNCIVNSVKRKAFYEGIQVKSSGLLDALSCVDVDSPGQSDSIGLSELNGDSQSIGILHRDMLKQQ
ncbi:hypothetical protein MP228_011622 [Amoeboaphelidium protococcarum]|nr:hypothetical protein MP228_011622 [Amoeboaphelidium protococcarum]